MESDRVPLMDAALPVGSSSQDRAVEVAFLDVGQGDTIVVTIAGGEAVIIDCVDAELVFRYLRDRDVSRVRALVLTHLHMDHYRGAVEFLENCEGELGAGCDLVYFNWPWKGVPPPSELIDPDGHDEAGAEDVIGEERVRVNRGLYRWVRSHTEAGVPLVTGGSGCSFPGDFKDVLELLQPRHGDQPALLAKGLNHTSAVIRVRGSGATALLTGDLEPAAWDHLVASGGDLRADLLKFPHHGGWAGDQASVGRLLDVVSPGYVVITVGTVGQRYGHPADSVFAEIAKRSPPTWLLCTQVTGKCCGDESLRAPVVQIHESHAATFGRPVLLHPSGCPCAGTVIARLGASAEIVQPQRAFHRDDVILPHFKGHRCRL
ncbi:MAG TPA: MBL fold metallo-hydrolase [Longimicrobium sp.]